MFQYITQSITTEAQVYKIEALEPKSLVYMFLCIYI